MTIDEALRELKGAKANKLPWMRIAEILQAARKTQRAGRLSGEFMDEAGRASGYAPGLLRRLEAARQFLLDLDRDHPQLRASERLGDAAAMVFKVEQLKRLYGVDREKALSLYEDVASGKTSVRMLENEYKTALGVPVVGQADPFGGTQGFGSAPGNPRPVRRLFASPFHAACWDALQKALHTLSGEGDIRLLHGHKFTYFSPFALAIGVNGFGIDFIDGFFPAMLSAQPNRHQLNGVLKDVAFQAPFFRRFWLLVPRNTGATACKELSGIGLDAVGCSELRDGNLTISCHGAVGTPDCQRQKQLAATVLEAGIPRSRFC